MKDQCMNMFLVEDFVAKKAAFEKSKSHMDTAITRVFGEYTRQKAEVSTDSARWRWRMGWEDYRLGHSKLHLTIGWWRGDQYDRSHLELPAELVQIAAESAYDADALAAGIAKIIKEEGEDIARREAILDATHAANQKIKDDEILARAEKIRIARNS
jgi:hypothetical protein